MSTAREYGHMEPLDADNPPISSVAIQCVPLDMVAHWVRTGATANFLADFLACDLENKDVGNNVISTVLNELLENLVKHSTDKNRNVSVNVAHWGEVISVETTNPVEPKQAMRLGQLIERIQTEDPEILFLEQIEKTAGENSNQSGLGLITIRKDYGARIGVKIAPNSQDGQLEAQVRVAIDVTAVEQA